MNMKHIPTEFVYAILAVAGGMAKYLSSYKEKHGRFAWGAFFIASFVSGFSGYMFALLGKSMSMPDTFIFIMAGMGGFMGEHALRFLGELILKKLGKDDE